MIVKPKGTYDLYGEQIKKWQYVSRVVDEIMDKYNYETNKTINRRINNYDFQANTTITHNNKYIIIRYS